MGEFESEEYEIGIYSGENEAVNAAQQECDLKKEEYDKTIEEDKEISEELKERRDENLEAIAQMEDKINQLQVDTISKSREKGEKWNEISALEENLNTMYEELSALRGSLIKDPNNTDQKNNEIKSAIEILNKQIEETEIKIIDARNEYEVLKGEWHELLKTLGAQKDELKELNEEKTKIEEEILANCSEDTKAALEAYNEAKENVEKVKAEELDYAWHLKKLFLGGLKTNPYIVDDHERIGNSQQTKRSISTGASEEYIQSILDKYLGAE